VILNEDPEGRMLPLKGHLCLEDEWDRQAQHDCVRRDVPTSIVDHVAPVSGALFC